MVSRILGKQPGGQHLLGVLLVEDTEGGPLGNHLGMLRVKLGNHHHFGFKVRLDLLLGNVHKGGVAAHPGGAGGGIDGEDALPGV